MNKSILYTIAFLSPAFVQAQTNTDILLLNMASKKNEIILSNARNITNHAGYDNQPHFHKSEPLVYYSSAQPDGKMDIRSYNIITQQTSDFTATPENEFSPTLTPDGKHVSCIIQRENGKQDLGMYNLKSKAVTVLIDNLTVGYHAWIDSNNLLLFVLAEDGHELQHYNLTTKDNKVLVKGIGRSLHKIPGKEVMSFIDKSNPEQWLIKSFDIKSGSINTIAPTLPGREDITWTQNGYIISSDGEKLYYLKPGKSATWKEINADPLFKGVTRLAVSPDNKQLAVVVSE